MTLRERCEEIMRLIDEVLDSDGHRGYREAATPPLLRIEGPGRPRATASGGER